MTKTQSLIIALILAGVSFFIIPITVEGMNPILYGVLKALIMAVVGGGMYLALRKFGFLALAICLALIIIFAPAPYALPIDGIAKFMVALAVIAGVLALEKRIRPQEEENEDI